jgi:hemerythrin-like domain-containing protein
MTIYDILKKDHRAVQGLLDQLISLDDRDESRFALAEKIRGELIPHSRAEEAVFYNSIRALDADSGKVMHGFKEHVEAETLLRTLLVKEKVKLDWKATAKKLKKALDHHIKEEESEIFALGKKVLTTEDAEKIGAAFVRMKPEIKEEGFMKTTLEMVKNLMPPKLNKVVNLVEHH